MTKPTIERRLLRALKNLNNQKTKAEKNKTRETIKILAQYSTHTAELNS